MRQTHIKQQTQKAKSEWRTVHSRKSKKKLLHLTKLHKERIRKDFLWRSVEYSGSWYECPRVLKLARFLVGGSKWFIACVGAHNFAEQILCVCRKAAKATLILFPLLGLTYLLFLVPPRHAARLPYKYCNSLLQSSQVPDTEPGHILRPSDPVTRESSDPEIQLTRWPCSIMNSKCRPMCRGVRIELFTARVLCRVSYGVLEYCTG